MSEAGIVLSVDMIRWSFEVAPERREAIESHLVDLGLDVIVLGDGQFHVTWEEPDRDLDEVASELWDLNEGPFDITQESFHRVSHVLIHSDEAGEACQAA